MADWNYPAGDPAAVNRWSFRLFKQSITKTIAWRLANISSSTTSEENVVQILDDTQKGPGDNITYDLIAKLSAPGVLGDGTVAGNEEALTTYTANIIINQLRHSVLVRGAMSQQRVPIAMRDTARVRLADWWQERDNVGLINQLTGNTFQTDVRFTGIGQLPTLPDTPHTIGAYIGGVYTAGPRFVSTNTLTVNEALLAAGDIFTQQLILNMVLIAHTNTFPIKPITLKGMQVNGVAILHPLQIRSLKANFSAGQWGDIQKAAMTGGQITGNPIFVGSIGMYEGVIIHEDAQIPYGDGTQPSSRNPLAAVGTTPFVARGVFCGAQAACMSMGRAQGNANRMKWVEELLDANNQLRVTSGKIYGIKKNVFNSQDFATITVSTYEVQ